jgi:hypothetical protein
VQLLEYVIRPVLKGLGLHSEAAERLVLGTACAESDCGRWLRQKEDGVALGIYQMEPATHLDIWINFLQYKPVLANKVISWSTAVAPDVPEPREMVGNLNYATAMCRVHYLRDPEPIPDTLPEQAEYWKRVYNTHLGAGTADGYIKKWRRFIALGVV